MEKRRMCQQRRKLLEILILAGGILLGQGTVASAVEPPKYDHIVVVVMENHSFDQIVRPGVALYLQKLAKNGALFTNSHGVAHPSQPNYLALFSGSTHGIRDDGLHEVAAPNLATRLHSAGKAFSGYAEARSPRKHNPWESFANAKATGKSMNEFPLDFARLPAVSFVIPNLANDMHDGTIAQADTWLKAHLGNYANWARSHNSLLIVTFDEDDYRLGNRIFTVLYGARVKPGRYVERIDHYTVLRTIEDIEGTAPLGATVVKKAIVNAWKGR
ncbi:alkaline phosphatase family protein [Mesorhizobium sp. M1E.F.Ca.ET.063.01.1.1]|uniref:alkaline phosphatase family protein n=1 Tax=Mesorhizobium sp. M1E.F.Ca.ET.063.01.1.1 TaxID=2496750 RepID=UPI000FCBB202|nr:alkaline phosphatase family protein [Mesorhizobium sp. M1E.F.Ca.ET.063.01.1.1]RUW85200.1 acid phosphatase [Mesorhizobium sp. M1E.F.Ca.ET.063.01.1.1]